jgi:hypothetical protein
MTVHPYHRKLARALDRMGALWTVQDILLAIAEGRMQSFAEGDSWAVTQIAVFPRAKVLEILVALGDLEACRILHDRILQFARDHDIGLVQAYGRRGWIEDAKSRGWKVRTASYLYQREL